MLKSSKGITLVALVITIVVLLILAGVTLSITFSDGIVPKAEDAATKYKEADTAEKAQLQTIEQKLDSLIQALTNA